MRAGLLALALVIPLAAGVAAREPIGRFLVAAGLPGAGSLLLSDPAWRGASLYESGRYAEAVEAFRLSAARAAAYNLGNALARNGRFPEAATAYRLALMRDPADRDAAANLALVEGLMQAGTGGGDARGASGATALRDAASPENAAGEDEDGARSTAGDGLAGQRQASGEAETAGSSRVDRRGDPSGRSREDGVGSSKGAAADTAGRSGKSGGLTTSAVSDDTAPKTEAEIAAMEGAQATRQWLAAIPDDPVQFVRLRILAERQKRLADGTALRVGGTAW